MMWKKRLASIPDSRLQLLFPLSIKWSAKPYHTVEFTIATENK
jgi:hypothetical protein